MMTNLVKGLHTELAIGLIGPEPEQHRTVAEKWQKAQFDVTFQQAPHTTLITNIYCQKHNN